MHSRLALACLPSLVVLLIAAAGFGHARAPSAANGAPLTVQRVTPAGEDVPAGRQLVIEFNRPVVPLGRMEREPQELPITVEPALDCQWRWLNTSALACQLGEAAALAPATRYRLRIAPGLRAEDGGTLTAPVEHTFLTERPRLDWLGLERWLAPGMPVLRAQFNVPVTAASVERALSLQTPQGRAPLRVAELAEAPRPGWLALPLPGEDKRTLLVRSVPAQPNEGEARRYWLLAPVRELPLDTDVQVQVQPGLRTPAGPEPGAESRVALALATFPTFRFLGVQCENNAGRAIRADRSGLCNPMRPVQLLFSTPVIAEEVKAHVEIRPDLAGGRQDYDPWANAHGYSGLYQPHQRGRHYAVTLPELLRAAQPYGLTGDGALRDEFGRTLSAPLTARFATDHRPPELAVLHEAAVLEAAVDTDMPLAVTNLTAVDIHYQGRRAEAAIAPSSRRLQLPAVQDVAYLQPLGVRELLEGRSGALWAELAATPAVPRRQEHEFFVQVTPFAVHAKVGHFNTLVWVTDLASGQPVAGAQVAVYPQQYRNLAAEPAPLAQSRTDGSGLAHLPGSEALDPQLQYLSVWGQEPPRLFVQVRRGDEMALLPLDQAFSLTSGRVSNWQIWSESRRRNGHLIAWGTTAQGIYRAGDTVQYKLYLRQQDVRSLTPPPAGPYTLTVFDPMDKPVHQLQSLQLSAFGAHSGEFTVPATGAVGHYRFVLAAPFLPAELTPLRVLVSDFTPAPFKVSVEINGERFGVGDRLRIDTRARMHAGGPYADAQTRVNVRLREAQLEPASPALAGFHFQTLQDQRDLLTLFEATRPVDAAGALTSAFTLEENPILYGDLLIESAVADERGKSVAGFARARYFGRDRYVGLKSREWVLEEDKPAAVDVAVIDPAGAPLPGVAVEVAIEREEVSAARVKGAGNAYLTQYQRRWVSAGRCELSSAAAPLPCRFTPGQPGSYRLTASIRDGHGRPHRSELRQWVVGKGRVLWSSSDDNALEVLPEKPAYQVGETARYLVKNPFPGAQALISVERYGVIDSWVQTLGSGTPLIEFPIKPDYLPGYYLSVVVSSPRVDKPLEAGQVDLGKPAFRMGYARTEVRDPYKEIAVTATPERPLYKPGERVRVQIQAAPRQGGRDQPIELAVAVLDEAVFDLLAEGRAYFDPYAGFYRLENLDLENYSLLLRLVGRQKFEKKGANAGGDGGGAQFDVRSNFKYVAYWNPSLPLARGRAQIEFDAPDNLTGWKLLVLAATAGDRLGLGEARVAVNQPTELRPVMPNQVIEGDRFEAGVSLMNRTDRPRELTVSWQVEGALAQPLSRRQTVKLAPYQRTTLYLPVTAAGPGALRFTVKAWDGADGDGLSHRLTVGRRQALETAASYGATDAGEVRESIHFPADMREDVGSLALVAAPSVIGNLEGAFRYLRDYPYTCWEQKLTQAVMAAHYQRLKAYLPESLEWPQAAALPDKVLAQAAAFQAPSGGMAFFVPEERYVSPYLSAYTALAFNWLRASGHAVPAQVERRLHGYLQTLLRQDVLPDFYSPGMASTVRAVALAALAGHGKVDRAELERYRPHVPRMDLFGRAHFLQAALQVPGTEAMRAELADNLLGHAVQSGGKFSFNEAWDDGYARILASPLRSNCVILSAMSALAGSGGAPVGDVPVRLTRFISQSRGARDHWENTQENVFCLQALSDYAAAYEAEPPQLTVTASLDGQPMGQLGFDDRRDPAATLARPHQAGDAGRRAELVLSKQGSGRYYYGLYLNYSPRQLKAAPINAGVEIRREYSVRRGGSWQLLESPFRVQRGELVRVDLYLSLPAARNFLVVDDPVPGGLEPVNRDLATASAVDADAGAFQAAGGSWYFHYRDWQYYGASRWSFYHKELRHDAARFYSDYLGPGNYHLSYTAQAIADGAFTALPVRAQEMYDPDVFGQGVAGELRVGE